MSPLPMVFKGIETFIRLILGDKSKREDYAHAEMQTLYRQFAAEFRELSGRTFWDSLVDGLNRLPRPLMTFGTIGLFVWCAIDPLAFTEAMVALQAVPELMWYILLTIVAFWFGGRLIESAPKGYRGPDIKSLKQLYDLGQERRYHADMQDETTPLSNESILEWNRRRQERTR